MPRRRPPRPRPRIPWSTGKALRRRPPAGGMGAPQLRERRSRGPCRPEQSSRRMSIRCQRPPTMARRRHPRDPRRPRRRSCGPAGPRRVRRCPGRRLRLRCRARALHRPLHPHRRPGPPLQVLAQLGPHRRRRRLCRSRIRTRSLQPPADTGADIRADTAAGADSGAGARPGSACAGSTDNETRPGAVRAR